MKVQPDTLTVVANNEAVSLELDVDAELSGVRLLPRFGDQATAALVGNAFDFPKFDAPNVVAVEWLASGSDEAAYVTTVDVISRQYFTLDQLRSFGDGRDEFYELPDEALYMARQAATEVFEQAARRSFVERLGATRDYGRRGLLAVRHDVRTLITQGYRQASDSYLEREPGCGPFPRLVEYTYGAAYMPAEVSMAVLELAAYTLRPANRPIGATGESTDAGYIHFTTAGRDGATAIPEVNAAIQAFGAGDHWVW